MKVVGIFLTVLTVVSCSYFKKTKEQEKPVARVYDKYLYRSDLHGVGQGAVRPEDSIQAVRNYIDSWIRHNIMLRYAQDNLPEEEQQLNDQLRDYKESLLIYLYEKELLSNKLDTSVSDEEIAQYFNDNRETFELKEGITQLKYIMLRKDTKTSVDSVRVWMRNTNDFNYPKLRGFCSEYAIRYSISDSAWYNKDELAALLPIGKFNFDNAQFNRNYLEIADSGYTYLVKFEDFRMKGNSAPIGFVHDDIYNIIINKRKLAFISNIHKSIYNEAQKRSDFEVYVDSIKSNIK